MPDTGAVLVRKYGKEMSNLPASESKRLSISQVNFCKPWASKTVAASSSINCTKRDMCVPFWSAGRYTVMVRSATVACGPLALAHCKGKRKFLMPTCCIGKLRTSTLLCTSGITFMNDEPFDVVWHLTHLIFALLRQFQAQNLLSAQTSKALV